MQYLLGIYMYLFSGIMHPIFLRHWLSLRRSSILSKSVLVSDHRWAASFVQLLYQKTPTSQPKIGLFSCKWGLRGTVCIYMKCSGVDLQQQTSLPALSYRPVAEGRLSPVLYTLTWVSCFFGECSVAWSSPQQNYAGNSVPGKLDWENSGQTQALHIQLHPVGFGLNVPTMGFLHTLLITFWFGHLWSLTLAREGRWKGCFIFLQIVPVFPGDWATGGQEGQVVLLCVPARGTGPPTAPAAMRCLGVSDTVCLLRPFLKPFWAENQKVWEKRFLCLAVFPGAIQQVSVWKNSQGKAVWLIFVVGLHNYFFNMEELTYLPYSMEASVGKKKGHKGWGDSLL